MDVLVWYLLAMNLAGAWLMHFDKRHAREGLRRVPERMLFAVALLGGSAGTILGMLLFRHKTRKRSFQIGLPAILILQILILYFLR